MSVAGKNLEAIVKAINLHNAECRRGRAIAVLIHPLEIDRMGHDPGDTVYGCELRADEGQGSGTFRLLCEADDTGVDEVEQIIDRELELVGTA